MKYEVSALSETFSSLLSKNPIVAAIKDDAGLQAVQDSECFIVFVLYGNICNISQIVKTLKEAGKLVFVHVDLLDGTSSKDIVLEFIRTSTMADGIISTKASIIKAARAQGLMSVHRFFLLDSLSLTSMAKQSGLSQPDCIEVLPGQMPKILKQVVASTKLPVIAGGLIIDKDDVITALGAGVAAISSTNPQVWSM